MQGLIHLDATTRHLISASSYYQAPARSWSRAFNETQGQSSWVFNSSGRGRLKKIKSASVTPEIPALQESTVFASGQGVLNEFVSCCVGGEVQGIVGK